MKNKIFVLALTLSIVLLNGITDSSYAEYSSLMQAVRDTATPREYTLNGTEQITSGIGSMAPGTLTINGTGAGSGILGRINSTQYSGIIVNSGSTLIMRNIGEASVDADTGVITYNSGIEGFKKSNGAFIYNSGTVTLEDVVLYNNNGNGAFGSAIYNNNGHITNITGKILKNQNASGAIYNYGTNAVIDSIETVFAGNTNANHGAAIVSGGGAIITEIKNSQFIANSSRNSGGAIRTNVQSTLNAGSEVSVNNSLFRYNSSRQGGAVQNGTSSTININSSLFDKNYSYNADNSSKQGGGGAIYNDGTLNITDSTFLNNATTYDGGAIYSSIYLNNAPISSVNITAKNDDVLFANNKSKVTSVSFSENDGYSVLGGIYNDFYGTNKSSLSLSANSGKNITFNGSVHMDGTTFNVNADNADNIKGGSYNFNNTVEAANISIYNGAEIHLGTFNQADNSTSYGVLSLSNFSNDANGGLINVQNNHIDGQSFGNLTLNSNIDLYINSDLANGVSDTFSATSLSGDGKLNIVDIDLLSDSESTVTTKVCNSVLKDAVTLAVNSVDGAVRSYAVIYDNSQVDGGYLTYSPSIETNLVVVNRNTANQRVYVLAADEDIAADIASIGDSSTSIGTMGGEEGAVFTVSGNNNYTVYGGGNSGITINTGRTLNVENIGSLNSDGSVKAGWQGFNGTLFENNGGTLSLTGTNVIANNQGDNSLIENTSGTISDFSADLINNTYSGVLVNNAGGEITNISGLISSNTASGLIHNLGTGVAESNIADISSDIISNNISSGGNIKGGVICNDSTGTLSSVINSISGDIKNNYVESTADIINGGIIYNYTNGVIGSLTSNIENNNIKVSDNSAIMNNSAGAIINNLGTLTIADNSVENNATNMLSLISNFGTLNIVADEADVIFDNNRVMAAITRNSETGEVTVSGGENEVIKNAGTLNLYAKSGKTITLNGQITDNSGTTEIGGTYDDNGTPKTYDGTVILNDTVIQNDTILNSGTLKLGITAPSDNTSDILNATDFIANSGTVDVADGNYTNYNIKKLTSSSDVRYNIDISLSAEEQNADTFTVGSGSTGTIYLSSINVDTENIPDDTSYVLQIIKASGGTGPQLSYDNAKVLTLAQAVMDSSDILAKDFGLYTTDTTNDSIMVRGLQDTFRAWSNFETDEHKQYTFLDDSYYTIANNITLNGNNNADIINNGVVVNNGTLKDFTLVNNETFTNDSVVSGLVNNTGTINNTGDLNGTINNEFAGTINTTISGIGGDITNNGNIRYTNGGYIENYISGNGTVHLDGDGTVELNADIDGNTLSLNNGTLVFGLNKDISKGGFIGNGGSIGEILDGNISTYKLGNAVLNENTKIDGIDFDLSNLTSDSFIANFSGTGKLEIDKVQVKGNTLKDSISVFLGDTTKVNNPYLSVKNQILPAIMTPIRRLTGKVENNYLIYSSAGNSAKDFNPAIFASPVSSLIGGQITQSQTLQDSFFHMNRYMKYGSSARIASENRNKYAQVKLYPPPAYVRSSLPETYRAMWVKPYTTFESVNLKGGLEVSNVAYGSLYGGDTDLVNLCNGYKGVISAFVGYNGAHQAYNGIDMNQQGGTLGLTGTMYRGNFFTGITVSAGASAGEASTPYGTDNFSMLTAGIANKTGYNIEIAEGKFIIQPTLYLGYTFVNNFDYKNSAGISIKSEPLNAIQIAPGINFIGNLDNGWQPYAGVNMMWNIIGKTRYRAADTRLPDLSVKPYVQYGIGVQKNWSERFTAFFQTFIRNGGRTGIVLEGGFRWTLGKEPVQKAKTSENNRTIIKISKHNTDS